MSRRSSNNKGQLDFGAKVPKFSVDQTMARRARDLQDVVVDALRAKYGSLEEAAEVLDGLFGDDGRPVSGSMLRAAAKNAERNYFRLEWVVCVLDVPTVRAALTGEYLPPEVELRMLREYFARRAEAELERFDHSIGRGGSNG